MALAKRAIKAKVLRVLLWMDETIKIRYVQMPGIVPRHGFGVGRPLRANLSIRNILTLHCDLDSFPSNDLLGKGKFVFHYSTAGVNGNSAFPQHLTVSVMAMHGPIPEFSNFGLITFARSHKAWSPDLRPKACKSWLAKHRNRFQYKLEIEIKIFYSDYRFITDVKSGNDWTSKPIISHAKNEYKQIPNKQTKPEWASKGISKVQDLNA